MEGGPGSIAQLRCEALFGKIIPTSKRRVLTHSITISSMGQGEGRSTFNAIGRSHPYMGSTRSFTSSIIRMSPRRGINPHLRTTKQFGCERRPRSEPVFRLQGYLAATRTWQQPELTHSCITTQFGWKEGRDPSAKFDTKAYLAANPDVAAADIDPLVHFLQFGIYEGRDPHADGQMAGLLGGIDRNFGAANSVTERFKNRPALTSGGSTASTQRYRLAAVRCRDCSGKRRRVPRRWLRFRSVREWARLARTLRPVLSDRRVLFKHRYVDCSSWPRAVGPYLLSLAA